MSKARKRALLGTVCLQAITLSSTRLAAWETKPAMECQGKKVTSVFTSCSGQIWVRDLEPGSGGRLGKTGVEHMVQSIWSLVQAPGLTPSVPCSWFQRGCSVWLPPGSHPYLTLLDDSGHGQLIILLQQTHLPFHGEGVELRARAWRGEPGTHGIVYERDPPEVALFLLHK